MNAPAPLRGLAAEAASGDRPEILARIREPGVAAAIWRRAEDPAFAGWIESIPPERLPRLRTETPPQGAAAALGAALAAAGTPEGEHAARMIADCAALARRFADIMAAKRLRLRLDVVEDDGCRRFHLDNVPARLLMTLRGRGTEYGALPAAGDPDPVFRLPAHAAAIFRGARWPGPEATGLVHRSPPIRAGETRLLLVVDIA